jgi:hypothetical protein
MTVMCSTVGGWAGHYSAVQPGRDVATGTLRGILADVGMTVEELQRLL